MAYTMTHVLVANKVLEYFDRPIDYSTYMVGAVAPDAVHANPNYSPKLKEKSHLFAEDLKWGEVTDENEFSDWLQSIKEFYAINHFKYDRDFFSWLYSSHSYRHLFLQGSVCSILSFSN